MTTLHLLKYNLIMKKSYRPIGRHPFSVQNQYSIFHNTEQALYEVEQILKREEEVKNIKYDIV
jgi:hypothetical protein